MLRNVSKLQFFDKIGQAKSVGFRFYSAIWRSESRISSRYLEITSISLIYSLPFSRKKINIIIIIIIIIILAFPGFEPTIMDKSVGTVIQFERFLIHAKL